MVFFSVFVTTSAATGVGVSVCVRACLPSLFFLSPSHKPLPCFLRCKRLLPPSLAPSGTCSGAPPRARSQIVRVRWEAEDESGTKKQDD